MVRGSHLNCDTFIAAVSLWNRGPFRFPQLYYQKFKYTDKYIEPIEIGARYCHINLNLIPSGIGAEIGCRF